MSVAPVPSLRPQVPSARPEIVNPRPRKPSNTGLWIGLLIALGMVVGAALIWQRRTAPTASTALRTGTLRTAKVVPGRVEKTIRLTGVTAAEDFVSLITPQLRGSHSDRLRDTSNGGPATSASGTATPSSSSNSSNSSSSGSGSSASGASGASGNGSSAFQSATSRFGGALRGSSPAPRASASAGTAAASSAMGGNGLGSPADSL